MLWYLTRRLVTMIPVLLIVTMIVFALMLLLPGDPAMLMLGSNATPQALASLRKELGLDQPIYAQYALWLWKAVQGDLGRSILSHQPVGWSILQALPVTIQVAAGGMIVAIVIAFPIGLLSALRRNSLPDILGTTFAMLGVAIPNFWLGIMLILLFASVLRWLPSAGYVSLLDDPLRSLKLTIMPSVTLGVAMAAVLMRQVRSSLLDVLGQEYILTARAKGLRERTVVGLHALRNALIPVATIMGLQVGRLFGGAVITEQIFAVPGIGRMAVNAIFSRDFPVVQGVVLVMAVAVMSSNLIVDLLYAYMDPRIRHN